MAKLSNARKTSDKPSRIYTFGARPPTYNTELVEQHFFFAHRYQNKRVEIERARRDRIRELERQHPEISVLEDALEAKVAVIVALRKEIKEGHSKNRSRETPTALRAQVKTLVTEERAERKACVALKRRMRNIDRTTDLVHANAVRAINEASFVEGKAAYNDQDNSPFWGTKLLVDKAMEAAKRDTDMDWGQDPKFRRWRGDSRIGVQLQGGLPVTEMEDSRWLQIVDNGTTKGGRRKLATVRMRVGSDGRDPVWAEFPIVLHRPLPPDAVAKWAWIKRRRVGTRMRYDFQITIEADSFKVAKKTQGPTLGIDIGWRKRGEDTLRVFYLDGKHHKGEVCLPTRVLWSLGKVDSLKSIQDRNFNEMREALVAWLQDFDLPEPLAERAKTLAQWRSQARLVTLAYAWGDSRFEGDEVIFDRLTVWRKQARHLYQWETNLREQALAQRKDFYRNEASRLAKQYSVIKIEDFDLRDVTELPEAEDEDPMEPRARFYRGAAALSEFRGALKDAAEKHGCSIEEVVSACTTMMCYQCGFINRFDKKPLRLKCGNCHATWDQDLNAAINVRRSPKKTKRGLVKVESREPAPVA